MRSRLTSLPAILDKEIKSRSDDKFGHKDLANALRSLIEDEKHIPPYSIGLLGGWGTGKSSIKELYINDLENDTEKCDDSLTRKQRIKTISFNAWRYGGENIRRALLREAYLALDGMPEQLWEHFFQTVSTKCNKFKNWKEYFKELGVSTLFPLLQMIILLILVYGVLILFLDLANINLAWGRTIISAIFTAALIPLFKFIFDPKKLIVSFFNEASRQELPVSTAIEYEYIFLDQLNRYISKNNFIKRLVIFIDDLDRLSAKEMVEGLDAVRSFMEMPGMPNNLGIVFVISCDEERVAKALDARKNRLGKDGMPAAVLSVTDARRFLDRLFQFRLEIPHPPEADMRIFAKNRFESDYKEIAEELADKSLPLESLMHHLIPQSIRSPRNTIQLLNAFVQSWWLAKEREFNGAGSDALGALKPGMVTQHPRSLAVISVLKVNFPEFYSDLQKYPDLLIKFKEVLFEEKNPNNYPRTILKIFKKYFNFAENNNEGKTEEPGAVTDVKEEYEELRTYISSVKSVQLAEDMAPILSLSVDPISRNLPGGARRAYVFFISNDARGFLGEIGVDNQAGPMDESKVILLENMIAQLNNATEDDQDNALNVIADMRSIIPDFANIQIMRPLVRRLSESRKLREMIGIDVLGQVVSRGVNSDQRQLASQLVTDFCKQSGEVEYHLQAGGVPTWKEVLTATKTAVEIVLEVRSTIGLHQTTESQLIAWFQERHIEYGKMEDNLPFTDLEAWIAKFGSNLLDAMGWRYTEAAHSWLSSGAEIKNIDYENVLVKCKNVFEKMATSGKRDTLWEQIASFIKLPAAEAINLSIEMLKINHLQINRKALNELVTIVCNRIVDGINSKDAEWSFDLDLAFTTLLIIIKNRNKEIDDESLDGVVRVTEESIKHVDTSKHSTDLMNELTSKDTQKATPAISGWINSALTTLPANCASWLAGNLADKLNDSQFDQLKKLIFALLARDNVTRQEAISLDNILGNIPKKDQTTDRARIIIEELFDKIKEHHQNPNNYIIHLLPVAINLMDVAAETTIGSMLHTLFANAPSNPQLLGFLHKQMVGRWINPKNELQPYNPLSYFQPAIDTVRSNSTQKWAPDIIASLISMLNADILTADQRKPIIKAFVAIWPHHSDRFLEILKNSNLDFNAVHIANLFDSVDITNEDALSTLHNVWAWQIQMKNLTQKIAVAKNILGKTAKSNEKNKDVGLSLWLSALDIEKIAVLINLIVDEDINFEQRKRIWDQIELNSNLLESSFFIDTSPTLLSLADFAPLITMYLRVLDAIKNDYEDSDRISIEEAHARALLDAPNLEAKGALAEWLKNNGGANRVFSALKGIELHPEDKKLLIDRFPGSKRIGKLKQMKTQDANQG